MQEKKKAKARSTKNHNTLQKLFNSAKGKLSEISSKHSQMSILNSKLQSDASKRMVASQLGQEPAAGAGARAGSGRPRTGSGRPVAEGVLRGSSGSGLPEGSALAAARGAHVARKKARVARFAGDDADSDAERETGGRGTAQPGQAGVGVRAASGSGHGGAAAPVPQRSADGSARTSLSGVAAAPSYPGFGGPGGAVGPEPPANAALAMEVMSAEEFDEFVSDLPTSRRNLLRAQFRVRKLVMWPMFDNFYLLAIMVNTVRASGCSKQAVSADRLCRFLTQRRQACPAAACHSPDAMYCLVCALLPQQPPSMTLPPCRCCWPWTTTVPPTATRWRFGTPTLC